MNAGLGPFTLAPILVPKPWGGRAIAPLLGLEPRSDLVGEGWLCSDLHSTSPTGAGGGAMVSEVEQGWGAGESLSHLLSSHGAEILGRRAPRFPLLLKVLDATRHLSVQVHPSPAYAQGHPDAHVKTEAWYALDVRQSGKFMVGVQGVGSARELTDLARRESVGDVLVAESVEPGDAVCIPSGTVHALGAGCVVFEVQTSSDTTYRLYDWSRETGVPPRALHLDQAERALDLSLAPRWSRAADRAPSAAVFATAAFDLHAFATGQHDLRAVQDTQIGDRAVLCFAPAGGATLRWSDGAYPLPVGRVTVVPATMAARVALHNSGASAVLTVLAK